MSKNEQCVAVPPIDRGRNTRERQGRRLVGYWIGREFWGKGLATRALQELTREVTQRPLQAWVATSNVTSIRVLEKCGFVRVGSHKNDVEELLFELRDGL